LLLVEGFRRAVLGFLVGKGAVSGDLRCKLLGWRHSGFSVQVRVEEGDAAGRSKLAAYMLRAPMSLEKDDLRRRHRHGDLPLEDAGVGG